MFAAWQWTGVCPVGQASVRHRSPRRYSVCHANSRERTVLGDSPGNWSAWGDLYESARCFRGAVQRCPDKDGAKRRFSYDPADGSEGRAEHYENSGGPQRRNIYIPTRRGTGPVEQQQDGRRSKRRSLHGPTQCHGGTGDEYQDVHRGALTVRESGCDPRRITARSAIGVQHDYNSMTFGQPKYRIVVGRLLAVRESARWRQVMLDGSVTT
jgi:hypothetical protein